MSRDMIKIINRVKNDDFEEPCRDVGCRGEDPHMNI